MMRILKPVFLAVTLAVAFAYFSVANAITTLTEYYVEDLEKILEKKVLRVLVVYDGVSYYFVDGHQAGLSVAMMDKFKGFIDENYLAKDL